MQQQDSAAKLQTWLNSIRRSLFRDFGRNAVEIDEMLAHLQPELSRMYEEGTSSLIATRLVQANFVLRDTKAESH